MGGDPLRSIEVATQGSDFRSKGCHLDTQVDQAAQERNGQTDDANPFADGQSMAIVWLRLVIGHAILSALTLV